MARLGLFRITDNGQDYYIRLDDISCIHLDGVKREMNIYLVGGKEIKVVNPGKRERELLDRFAIEGVCGQ